MPANPNKNTSNHSAPNQQKVATKPGFSIALFIQTNVIIPLIILGGAYLMYYAGFYEYLSSYASTFHFEYDTTPITNIKYPIIITSIYVISILMIPSLMKNSQPLLFTPFTIIHNFLLSFLSLFLFLILLPSGIQAWKSGFHNALCSDKIYESGLVQMQFYVNHLLKYYEFIDTFLIVFRKKPVEFLHFYHHAMTLLLTWVILVTQTTAQWVAIEINLFIHVIMYYYYALSAIGIRDIWWKRYLTMIQIVQFVIDVIALSYTFFAFYMHPQGCNTTPFGSGAAVLVLISYLVLFIQFYFKTYQAKKNA